MAIIQTANQYSNTGKKPLDAKALVQTFAALTSTTTWLNNDGEITAYNGMLTAVWLDKVDSQLSDKNGIYFLFDPEVTSTRGTKSIPDVTKEANWHKLGGINDIPGLTEQIAQIQEELEAVKNDVDELQESATVIIEPGQQLPETGTSGKLYVVLEEATTYVWYNNAYMPVGDGVSDETPEIQIIHGGSAR
jgi:hypothetical protein